MLEQVPQLEEFEEPVEETESTDEKPAFAQPSVLMSSKEKMEQVAGEVLNMKMQGYEDEEIKNYISQKYNMDKETAELTFQMLMQYIEKRAQERQEIQKQALGMIPTLAQSDNPFVGFVMQSLIEKSGLVKDKGFAQELIELQKELMKSKMMMEMSKEILGTEQKSGYDPLMAQLIKSMMEEKKQAEQQLFQLLMAQVQGRSDEQIQQLAEIVRQSIEALNQKIEAVLMSQASSTSVQVEGGEKKDFIEQFIEFQEKLKQLKEMGIDIKLPGEERNDPVKLYEMQAKMKELELKKKEIEAKQVLYSKLAEALSNPDTIRMVFNGLSQLLGTVFKRGPTPATYQGAMMQAATVQPPTPAEPVEPVSPPADVPSLDEFLNEEGAEDAGQD